MTAEERAGQVKQVSEGILARLRASPAPVDAGTLIRDYCQENDVNATIAEIALLFLLNEGSIETNHKMLLEGRVEEAA